MDIDSELVSDEEIEGIAMGTSASQKVSENADIIAPASEKAESAE